MGVRTLMLIADGKPKVSKVVVDWWHPAEQQAIMQSKKLYAFRTKRCWTVYRVVPQTAPQVSQTPLARKWASEEVRKFTSKRATEMFLLAKEMS